jgi:hypothetical protein
MSRDLAGFGELADRARQVAVAAMPARRSAFMSRPWRYGEASRWRTWRCCEVILQWSSWAGGGSTWWPSMPTRPLRSLAERAPLDERVHARLMAALAGTGQQAAALAMFEELRLRLGRELGVRPGSELATRTCECCGRRSPCLPPAPP